MSLVWGMLQCLDEFRDEYLNVRLASSFLCGHHLFWFGNIRAAVDPMDFGRVKNDPLKVGELLSILQCIGELMSIL